MGHKLPATPQQAEFLTLASTSLVSPVNLGGGKFFSGALCILVPPSIAGTSLLLQRGSSGVFILGDILSFTSSHTPKLTPPPHHDAQRLFSAAREG